MQQREDVLGLGEKYENSFFKAYCGNLRVGEYSENKN